MRIVCISDTHTMHDQVGLPEGDVLVHAGDSCGAGSFPELRRFTEWLRELPHEHKVVVAGNHDWPFEREPQIARRLLDGVPGVRYLQDSGTTINGVTFWGSPWQPEFRGWAFNLPRGKELANKWRRIPSTTDVLITHGPPAGIRDCIDAPLAEADHLGCVDLRKAVSRVRPQVHIFGHIHGGYGTETANGTRFVNAAICTEGYRPVNAPIVVDVEPKTQNTAA